MKRLALALPALALLLASCTGSSGDGTISQEELLQNPLFAEQYYDDLVDRMVDLFIRNDPVSEDPDKKDLIEDTRTEALNRAKQANAKQRDGIGGDFISVNEHSEGEVLYLENMLYFGPEFVGQPGPELHIYLSKQIDPRDAGSGSVLGIGAVDIGILQSPYGAQQYAVPEISDPEAFHTVILWDSKLERLYGFAQISR